MTPVDPTAERDQGGQAGQGDPVGQNRDRAVERYADLARRILDRPPRLGSSRLVAVDGPSGAGKTVFAQRLTMACGQRLGGTHVDRPAADFAVPVVRTDDLLDGWADQFSFWPRLEEWLLAPLRAGQPGGYRRYDWHRGEFGTEEAPVPPAPVVILEGVSTARASVAAELTYAVFVTAPSELRRQRAVARDGSEVLPQLDAWRRAERAHFTNDGTAFRVDLLVDGAPRIAHDPDTEYVRLRRSAGGS